MNDRSKYDESSGGLATAEYDLPSQRSLQRRGWLSAGMLLLVFLAGGVTGAAVARTTRPREPLGSLQQIPARVANCLQREFGLSDEQRNQIEQIGRSHQAELRRIRAQVAPQMRAELRKVIVEIAAVLTPTQAEKWQQHAEDRLDALVPVPDAGSTH